MLVQCPECKSRVRVTELAPSQKVIKYFCSGCQRIVSIDLIKDEVRHTSSSASFSRMEFKKTVLVADDATYICDMVQNLLVPSGYKVLCASDGLAALKMVKEHHPDLILLDLLMPRMTGFDVLRELRRNSLTKDTPVLVMSGVCTNPKEIGLIQGLGATGFITKDALADNLLFRVTSILQTAAAAS